MQLNLHVHYLVFLKYGLDCCHFVIYIRFPLICQMLISHFPSNFCLDNMP